MSLTEIQSWLTSYLADFLNTKSEEIDIYIPFDRYGLDSSATVSMIAELENSFQCNLDPAIVYYYPTIESLTQYLSKTLI
ncbi:acyl carrier protein [Myxosarcina sp. GI1]|uniref:acyl carrier protein n=1 Tax=Myxosarcina sp. GI1 TaxID=1541065 RepID=UPI000559E701|nr:acyl carrier protein [Myxosarcina sp. GI1]